MDFTWLSNIIEGLLQFIPRPVIIRATHGGVCWICGYKVIEMKPGWRFVWPLIMDYEIIPVARQTNILPTQALITKDKHTVAVGAMIVFSIRDILRAVGQRNFDVMQTVNDITAAAVVKIITQVNLDSLLVDLTGKVEEDLTVACRKQLRAYGVYVHRVRFVDFSTCKIYKVLGTNPVPQVSGI